MKSIYDGLPKVPVKILCGKLNGKFEGWRCSVGHGGINKYPLPPYVIKGIKALKPKLIRTFIQEYFNIYPEHGVFDWSSLDPYMRSLADTGAKIIASICIKPKPLYPTVDEKVFMPNDAAEWQAVVEELVKRYSVRRQWVTRWEISNESDIGENGGVSCLTPAPDDYNKFYDITARAVLRAFPGAKVGGPALAYAASPLMEGLIKHCKEDGVQLDFVSWHKYSDNPGQHSGDVVMVKELLEKYYPESLPEMMVTELGNDFPAMSIPENAYDLIRPASLAVSLLDCLDAGLDWSFYYHVWDQVFIAGQFRPFFADPDIMLEHWNKIPHRMGLFGVCGEIRPNYFVYRLLGKMQGNIVETGSADPRLRIKTVKDETGSYRTMLINYDFEGCCDLIAETDFIGIESGLYKLTVWRLAESQQSDKLKPVEQRYIDISPADSKRAFYTQTFCPEISVTLIELTVTAEKEMLEFYYDC
jgi:hypothetical protein